MKSHGFTFLELIIAVTMLAVLAAAAVPATRQVVKREKEMELKRVLLQMREAIDRYKTMADAGEINAGSVESMGYPEDLELLVAGVPLAKKPGQHIRFLRRVPMDPMTGEASWGKRAVQDDVDDDHWGGQNVFDVYSLSDGIALDGTEYSSW